MKNIAILAGLAGFASATSWTKFEPFSCPSNTNNVCNPKQQSGFDWSELSFGEFSSYSEFSFDGFSCAKSFNKRDALTKRTFQDKCITGSLSQGSGPKLSYGKSSGFSIAEYQISVSIDIDVEFLYTMEDGSSCRHVSPCRAGGSIIQNTQCGGAKQVSFQLPSGSKSNGCNLGIHSVGFDCRTRPATARPTSVTTISSSSSETSTYTSTERSTSVTTVSSSSSETSTYTSTETTSTSKASVPMYSSSAPSYNSSTSASSATVPKSYTQPTSHSQSTSEATSTSTSSSKSPVPSAPCPDVLPKCLNTWLQSTSCKDNSDHSCFCKEADFTAKVIECVSAWGVQTVEIQAALTYLVGICAPYIPQNPGIITNCPSTIPLSLTSQPTPPSTVQVSNSTIGATSTTVVVATTVTTCPAGQTVTGPSGQPTVYSTPVTSTIYITSTSTICTRCEQATTPVVVTQPASIPYTTITVAQTVTVPCTYTTGVSYGMPIPSSSTVTQLSTVVVVPQVQLTTATAPGTSNGPVGLGYGAPPTVSVLVSSSTPAAGVATTSPAALTTATTPAGFGTTYVPRPTNGTTSPVPFTGAAALNKCSVVSIMAAAGLALLAL